MSVTENKQVRFSGIKDGETFKIGNMEFIKFPSEDGITPVVMKDIAFTSRFGKNNDLNGSVIMDKMKKEILPQIMEAVGEENLCTFKTDLTTLDGLKPYGVMESLISLPTIDFYRANVEIFDKYNLDQWWWLATPESARPHSKPYWTLCVSPSGFIFIDSFYNDFGVRPFLSFKSSIFESSED